MKALFIGTAFIEKIAEISDFFWQKDIISEYSPLTKEFNDLFADKIKDVKYDVIIIDLSCCAEWLYNKHGDFYVLNKLEKSSCDSIKSAYNPAEFRYSYFDKYINLFFSKLGDYEEKGGKVILIASHPCPYFLIDNQLRQTRPIMKFKEWRTSCSYVKKVEERLSGKVKADICNLREYYFWKKQKGITVSDIIMEDEFYEDVYSWMEDYLKEGKNRTVPRFDLSLRRYIKYQNKTILYKAFHVFLDPYKPLDYFVLSCPREYVEKNYDNLIIVSKTDCNDANKEIIDNVKELDIDSDFKDVITGFLLSLERVYDDGKLKKMFKQGIVSQVIKKEIRDSVNVSNKIINEYNAGYYYALSKGFNKNECMEWVGNNTEVAPVLVDVYGSCIAYQSINSRICGGFGLAVNNYYMHVPVYESSPIAVEHKGVDLCVDPDDEFEKNVRIQFSHGIEKDLMESEALWCVIDLYSMVCSNTFLYGDFCFTDSHAYYKRFGKDIENISPWKGYYDKLLESEEFIDKIIVWCGWIKKKYGSNIIFLEFDVSLLKIGDDDILYRKNPNADKKNEIIHKVQKIIDSYLDGYHIVFSKGFLADDVGYMRSSSVHYEFVFYNEVYKVINYIVKNKPVNKYYKYYSNITKLKRMLRLMRKNDRDVLATIFKGKIDHIILNMDSRIVEEHFDNIVEIMDCSDNNDLSRVMSRINDLEYDDVELYREIMSLIDAFDENKNTDKDFIKTVYKRLKVDYKKNRDEELKDCFRDRLRMNLHYKILFFQDEKKKEPIDEQMITFGVNSRLKSAPEKKGHLFMGWKAVRVSDNKVAVKGSDGKKEYRKEPDNKQELYLLPDKCIVAKDTKVDGDSINLYAVYSKV